MAQVSVPGAEQLPAAREGNYSPTYSPTTVFEVVLADWDGSKLGIEAVYGAEGLLVKAVDSDGAVAQHNLNSEGFGISPGDTIVSVNGLADLPGIMAGLQKAGKLRLSVRRRTCAVGPQDRTEEECSGRHAGHEGRAQSDQACLCRKVFTSEVSTALDSQYFGSVESLESIDFLHAPASSFNGQGSEERAFVQQQDDEDSEREDGHQPLQRVRCFQELPDLEDILDGCSAEDVVDCLPGHSPTALGRLLDGMARPPALSEVLRAQELQESEGRGGRDRAHGQRRKAHSR